MEGDLLGLVLGGEQPERVLRRPALVQKQPAELFLLDAGEGVVDDGQHEVHEEVQVDGEVRDEEERRPTTVIVAPHHYVGIAVRASSRYTFKIREDVA